jgi:hypothetical protein
MQPVAYDEMVDLFADSAVAERILNFHPSLAMQARIEGKAMRLLRDNPRHPGLCSHMFSGLQNPYDPGEKVWESYVQNNTPGAYRIFWCYGPSPGWITIISITPHP